MIAAVVAGLAPALKATRPNLVNELKNDVAATQAGGRRWTLRDGLVATQIAVTLVLLVAAGLLTRSLVAAQHVGIGFRTDGLAIVSTEMSMLGYDADRSKAFYDRALERVRAIPGVESAALAERLPFSINYNRNNVFLPGPPRPGRQGAGARRRARVAGVFRDARHPDRAGTQLRGRPTRRNRRASSSSTRRWRGSTGRDQNALGKRIRAAHLRRAASSRSSASSANYKVSTVGEETTPYLHYAISQRPGTGEEIVARTHGDAGALLAAMRRELLALEPNVILLDNQTMDAQVAATLLPAKAGAIGVSAVGVVAMLLASIGLYGVIAYSVARRTREIGIRMALGAQPSAVVGLVMKQGLGIAAVGVGVGAVAGARRGEGDGRRALRRQLRRSAGLERGDRIAARRRGAGESGPGAARVDRRSVERAAVGVARAATRACGRSAEASRSGRVIVTSPPERPATVPCRARRRRRPARGCSGVKYG